MAVVAITDSDQERVGSLLQFLSMNVEIGEVRVFHPVHHLFDILKEFFNQLYPDKSANVKWIAVKPNQTYSIGIDVELEVFRTDFPGSMESNSSVGYRVVRNKKKLRQNYFDRKKNVDQLINNSGEEAILQSVRNRELAFCGRHLPLDREDVKDANCLVLECRFPTVSFGHKKEDFYDLNLACEFLHAVQPKRAILSHFSERYCTKYLLEGFTKFEWPCPVELTTPGQILQLP